MLRPIAPLACFSLLVTGCATPEVDDPPPPVAPPEYEEVSVPRPQISLEERPLTLPPTLVKDQNALVRLISNSGLTLQWIGWETRGQLRVFEDRGIYRLDGSQTDPTRPGAFLQVNGRIEEIGADYFILDGEIAIVGTPDEGRNCKADKLWRFAVTQNRKYWRLREFEWCDGLTDYVDIYF